MQSTALNNVVASRGDRWLQVFAVALVVFLVVLVVNAWVVDDAYITFRTVENIVNGHGATWNIAERVQGYSHPLWMLLILGGFWITSDVFWTCITISVVLTVASVLVAASFLTQGFGKNRWKPALLLIALVGSKAFIDFATSGLENSLSYVIAAAFVAAFVRDSGQATTPNEFRCGLLLSSLAFITRPDSLLVYLPCVIYLAATCRMSLDRRLKAALIASSPATLWLLFSLLYYGYPLPNTAYAKSSCTGFPASWTLQRGLEYALNSIRWDTASHAMLAASCVLCLWKRNIRVQILMAGTILYCALVVASLAATTHMSGRHFALPFFISIVVLTYLIASTRVAVGIGVALGVFVLWSPVSALKFGTTAYQPYEQNPNYIDTKFAVYTEHGALISNSGHPPLSDDPWFEYGLQARFVNPTEARVGPEAVGLAGFAAASRPFIVDSLGLTDPFLSRLPARRPFAPLDWKSGHFPRVVPDGYLASVQGDTNVIMDERLRRDYGVVRSITRGSLLRWQRFKDIWDVNSGRYSGSFGKACFAVE